MKKILFFLLFFQFSFSQALTETEKLTSYCKIWGFLKYYHPELASGKKDWNTEFFKLLNNVRQVNTKDELSNLYIGWIDGLGKIKERKKTDKTIYFEKNFNLSWLEDSNYYTPALTSKLKFIKENRFEGKHHYVFVDKNGYLTFTNEMDLKDFEANNNDAKFFSLFDYWNKVEYFYPYKYLMDENWDTVLTKTINNYEKVTTKNDYILLIKQLVAKLDDSHAFVFTNQNMRKRVPFKVKEIDNKAVVFHIDNDSLAKIMDIKRGDVILEMNGVSIKNQIEENKKHVAASNLSGKKIATYTYILYNTEKDTNTLKIERSAKIEERKIIRYLGKEIYASKTKDKPWKLIGKQTAYINFGKLEENQVDEMLKEVHQTQTLIFDIRNYPTFHTYLFSKLFESKKTFSVRTIPSLEYPGKFTIIEDKIGVKNKNNYKGKIILLVDETSISRAEYMAMAFQAFDNVITIGSQTAGANGDVVNFNFSDGFYTGFSGSGVYYPDGSDIQRKGVKIDITVMPTIKGLQSNKDEILEKALEIAGKK